MPAHGGMFGTETVFHYTTDTSNGNLFTKAGSPAYVGNFVFVVDPGVTLYGSTISSAALRCPTNFAAGSTVKLIVLGRILGAGGLGGDGSGSVNTGGRPGGKGGDAMDVSRAITIDVTNGLIGGGGGGGQGGSGASISFPPYPTTGGGGGGGGAGRNTGQPGVPNGQPGTDLNGGAGGAPPTDQEVQVPGDGGYGGGGLGQPGGQSGAAGNAVRTHSSPAITWIGRNTNTVRGAVGP
jgi:hypothetical protein